MTAVLQSPSHLPSSQESCQLSCSSNDALQTLLASERGGEGRKIEEREKERKEKESGSLLGLLVDCVKRSLSQRRTEGGGGGGGGGAREEEKKVRRQSMEIGSPTDVRHVAHVTFDRYHGFLGLPVEFEPEVPRRAPSASTTVFGVSTESMQCSYDSRGNSIPTILLLMQRHLYERGGLQAEGIFRVNADNSQEEYVRNQLNSGIVPDEIDVHCLSGLIKAWFRELPTGVLDPLRPEQVKECQSEEQCAELVNLLPPTEAALVDWAINLMADVVQEEHKNKMDARNVAMVFAPNMTKTVDRLDALMYAVKVMNFLKMLIVRTLNSRQEPILEDAPISHSDPSDEDDHHSAQLLLDACRNESPEQVFVPEEPVFPKGNSGTDDAMPDSSQNSHQSAIYEEKNCCTNENHGEIPLKTDGPTEREEIVFSSPAMVQANVWRTLKGKSSNLPPMKSTRKSEGSSVPSNPQSEKSKRTSILTHINSKAERIEAWR